MERYQDTNGPLNGPEHHTGKQCVEPGCVRPAGTHWSEHWCQPCNSARMDRISESLNAMFKQSASQTTWEGNRHHDDIPRT